MPRKVRELVRDLLDADFYEIPVVEKDLTISSPMSGIRALSPSAGALAMMRSLIRKDK